ncbi:MAG: bile acid:sodium symporter [Deltaproteobacteria bacterium]|nr:bile acid:sodium symporter [Deltaproteobacteria bacterium]
MTEKGSKSARSVFVLFVSLLLTLFFACASFAETGKGEKQYSRLSKVSKSAEGSETFYTLNTFGRLLDWDKAEEKEFEGYVRHLSIAKPKGQFEKDNIYLLRNVDSELLVIMLPKDIKMIADDADSVYAGLAGMVKNKMSFKAGVISAVVNGEECLFTRFTEKPKTIVLFTIFKIAIVLMLFFIMLGMGLTLTLKDFALVFKKPGGMLIGAALQWGFMPLFAMLLGKLLGFYEYFPFIYVGMILVAVSPGGVTSNLMTHLGKGDLALSISLTSFSTVLSLVLTPLLLAFYCSNVPEVTIPAKLITVTIVVLVIIPLSSGMAIRSKWKNFAERSVKFFSILGVISLVFIIVAGLLMGGDYFADTDRYGLLFYGMLFVMTSVGMLAGIFIPKLFGISNYQSRALSLETGLRNTSLSMAIAILIQDLMGDFYSAMFFTSAIFGLGMFFAGGISIALFKTILPLDDKDKEAVEGAVTEQT